MTLKQFAESVIKTVSYVYGAVAHPVEGTMLTVIRDCADYIYSSRNKFSDFNNMISGSCEILKKSLLETTSKLAILGKNNVVDAGAKGFVLFFEGIMEFINTRNIRELISARTVNASFEKYEEVFTEKMNFRYCTEAVIKDCRFDREMLLKTLEEYGDSVVVAGADKLRRIHLHTNNPADLFDNLRKAGTITFQKADDMIRHYQTANERKWNIALVTDSTCDLSQDLIDHLPDQHDAHKYQFWGKPLSR